MRTSTKGILGNSWNYMPPILVPYPAKRIATQILVIAKLEGRQDFFLKAFFVISSHPARNYLFKVSNSNTRIRCENCSALKMKALERRQWRRCSVFILNCRHISNFVLIVDFEQANVCWVHIENTNIFEGNIAYIMPYVVVF